eukprot:992016-Rhodomonas_salina.3
MKVRAPDARARCQTSTFLWQRWFALAGGVVLAAHQSSQPPPSSRTTSRALRNLRAERRCRGTA